MPTNIFIDSVKFTMLTLSSLSRSRQVCRMLWRPREALLVILTGMMFVFAFALVIPVIAAADASLLDGRTWEMVSSPNKNGGQIESMPVHGLGTIQASAGGDKIAYLATMPIGPHVEGNTKELTQMLAVRGSGGWSSSDITTPDSGVAGQTIELGNEYRFFSADLSSALVEQLSAADEQPPLLSSEASERTIYLRNDATGSYRPLVTRANTRPGAVIAPAERLQGEAFVAATPDLEHVVLASTEALTANTVPVSSGGILYEWTNGALDLVSVLPNGNQALPASGTRGPFMGNDPSVGNVRNAISTDGDRVVWGDQEEGTHLQSLYMTDMATGKSIRLNAAQGVAEPKENYAVFQTASATGSRVFFTDGQRLTRDSTAGGPKKPDLYVCEIHEEAGGLACSLKDLSIARNPGESARVRGEDESFPAHETDGTVIGAAENGSVVYFVARGVLTVPNGNGEPVNGNNNLYMERYDGETGTWTDRFIAALSDEDTGDWGGEHGLRALTARVSPNGEYLAFMSDRELTSYHNKDVNSGEPDEEVFRYGAATNHLVCVSCDPSGAPPFGVFDEGLFTSDEAPLVDRAEAWAGHWLAGSLPGWATFTSTNALHQPRYLANTGRLFFDSPGDLTNQAVNGQEDVYEYEPVGVGGCGEGSAMFIASSGGCVGLVSGGTSSEESAFVDASESGDDVFFVTAAQLVPQDVDHSLDLYDAPVCSQLAPCFVAPATSQPLPCGEDDSCRIASREGPGVMEPPASMTFVGAGDIVQEPLGHVAPKVTRNKARKLSTALSKCRRAGKRKRAGCRVRARARYGRTRQLRPVVSPGGGTQ